MRRTTAPHKYWPYMLIYCTGRHHFDPYFENIKFLIFLNLPWQILCLAVLFLFYFFGLKFLGFFNIFSMNFDLWHPYAKTPKFPMNFACFDQHFGFFFWAFLDFFRFICDFFVFSQFKHEFLMTMSNVWGVHLKYFFFFFAWCL